MPSRRSSTRRCSRTTSSRRSVGARSGERAHQDQNPDASAARRVSPDPHRRPSPAARGPPPRAGRGIAPSTRLPARAIATSSQSKIARACAGEFGPVEIRQAVHQPVRGQDGESVGFHAHERHHHIFRAAVLAGPFPGSSCDKQAPFRSDDGRRQSPVACRAWPPYTAAMILGSATRQAVCRVPYSSVTCSQGCSAAGAASRFSIAPAGSL